MLSTTVRKASRPRAYHENTQLRDLPDMSSDGGSGYKSVNHATCPKLLLKTIVCFFDVRVELLVG